MQYTNDNQINQLIISIHKLADYWYLCGRSGHIWACAMTGLIDNRDWEHYFEAKGETIEEALIDLLTKLEIHERTNQPGNGAPANSLDKKVRNQD